MHLCMRRLILCLVAFLELGCGCNDVPELTPCTDSTCIGRRDETQLTCNCALDVSGAGEAFTSSVDQVFDMQVCLPSHLNVATASPEQLANIEALSDAEYAAAVAAYCQSEVASALTALIGLMTGSDPRACDNVAASCVATPANDGRATAVNTTCNVPCATTPCDAVTCPPCEVNEGCNDPALRGVHPEQCKCTQATGCGVTSPNVCTIPTWAPDPPETAVGWLARQLSQPTEITIDDEVSQALIDVTVDPGFPCSSSADGASPHVRGNVSLFGTPCPGETCDMLLDFELSIDNFRLDFGLGVCPDAFVESTATTLAVGGEGVAVHLESDGCGVLAPGDLRVIAASVLNLDGDLERRTFDSKNSEPVMFCVDFANRTFELPSGTLELEDGSVTLYLAGTILNQPPLAVAGPAQVAECDQAGAAAVTLDGTASSDPDGPDDFRSFVWWQGDAFDPAAHLGFGPLLEVAAPLGTTEYQLTVSDLRFVTMASRTQITVEDTTAPSITVSVTPATLWPPNHEMVPISATVNVVDVCDPSASFVLKSIVSNEPENGTGDGDTAPDIEGAAFGTPDLHFSLRRERKGNGSGRLYTITYTATDVSGNAQDASAVVSVRHDQSG